jgi:hypothetical protein
VSPPAKPVSTPNDAALQEAQRIQQVHAVFHAVIMFLIDLLCFISTMLLCVQRLVVSVASLVSSFHGMPVPTVSAMLCAKRRSWQAHAI